MRRSEQRDAFLLEVEMTAPELMPLARAMERRVPLVCSHQSRVEWFMRYVEENPEGKDRYAQAEADRAARKLIWEREAYRDFKRQCAIEYLGSPLSLRQVAVELMVPPSSLWRWVQSMKDIAA